MLELDIGHFQSMYINQKFIKLSYLMTRFGATLFLTSVHLFHTSFKCRIIRLDIQLYGKIKPDNRAGYPASVEKMIRPNPSPDPSLQPPFFTSIWLAVCLSIRRLCLSVCLSLILFSLFVYLAADCLSFINVLRASNQGRFL